MSDLTHEQETHMNLSWLWPKLVMPKRKNPESGCARDPADAFIEACERDLAKAKRELADKDRLDEIGKLAHQILVQKVASSNDHKRYQLNSRDVQEAWDSATDIYNLTRAHRAAVEKCHDEQAPVVRSFVQ